MRGEDKVVGSKRKIDQFVGKYIEKQDESVVPIHPLLTLIGRPYMPSPHPPTTVWVV